MEGMPSKIQTGTIIRDHPAASKARCHPCLPRSSKIRRRGWGSDQRLCKLLQNGERNKGESVSGLFGICEVPALEIRRTKSYTEVPDEPEVHMQKS